jgi:hypothetical protein
MPLLCAYITVVKLQEGPKATCGSLGFQESSSEVGHQKGKFQVLLKPVGSISLQKRVASHAFEIVKKIKTCLQTL